jgi:hypothetical protein
MLDKKVKLAAVLIPLLLLASCIQDQAPTVDPRRFVFATCWGIWTANQDGSAIVKIVTKADLGHTLCPVGLAEDGERVAYWADNGDNVGLWISEIDAWSPRLTSEDWPASFEPTGVQWGLDPHLVFVYGAEGGLYVVDLDTGQRDSWDRLCLSVGVSPRTHQLAGWDIHQYRDDNPVADVVEQDGSHWQFSGSLPSNLVSFEGCATHAFPALETEQGVWCWSPDHTRIAIGASTGVSPELMILGVPEDARDSLIVDSFQLPGYASDCAWSPQGQYIAFKSTCTNGDEHCVFVLDLHRREVIWEAEGHGPLYWNPDDTRLFFNIGLISPDYELGVYPVGTWSLDLTTLETSRILKTTIETLAWRTAPIQEGDTVP